MPAFVKKVKIGFIILFSICMGLTNQSFALLMATDSLLNALNSATSDTTKINILISLSLNKGVSKDSAMLFSKKAILLAEKNGSDKWLTNAYINLGNHYPSSNDENDTALTIYRNIYERMSKNNYIPGMAISCKLIGRGYLHNAVDSAIFYTLKCINLFKSIYKEKEANSAKINLAVVYAQSGRIPEAINMTKEAFLYSSQNNLYSDAGTAAINLGIFYRETGDFKNAITYIKENIYYNNLRHDDIGVNHGKATMADVLTLQGKYNEATDIYHEVIAKGKLIHSNRLLNYGYHGLATIALKKQQWKEVISNSQLSYDYSEKNNNEKSMLYDGLFHAYKGINNFKEALHYLELYHAVSDSFKNEQRLEAVDELEARYQNKEKQAQISLLNKENKIRRDAEERQLLIRNIIIGLSVLSLVLAGLLFNRFKLKKKIESQQALINERKRISHELHDDLGAQLSTARMFLNSLKNNAAQDNNISLIENSINLIDGSIQDLRKIMDDLQASTLQEKGYIAATEELVNKINQLQQMHFTLSHHGMDKRPEPKVEHQLFRATQELINNSLKYAKANEVSISLVNRDGKIILMYEDDGIGFDMKTVKKGYGLKNITSRVLSVSGIVEFDSYPGKGSRTTIEIPVNT